MLEQDQLRIEDGTLELCLIPLVEHLEIVVEVPVPATKNR
jgi:hypothetical protein